jgi:cytochrome c biogenesis protein
MTERYNPEEQQALEWEGASGVESESPSQKASGSGKAPLTPLRDHLLIRILSSLVLAITLFMTLAVLTIFGTFIEQGRDPSFYTTTYGPKWGPWILNLKIDNIYHSWYYVSLLSLLCVNALSCVYRRFPVTIRSLFRERVSVSRDFLKKQREYREIEIPHSKVPAASVPSVITETLATRHYKVQSQPEGKDVALFAHKGVLGRIGSHVAHLSVIVILAGGLLGSLTGFRLFGTFYVNSTTFIPQGGWDLRVNKFWIEHYKNGMVKSYFSDVDIVKDGKVLKHKIIQVNHPLSYDGLRFYQASFGEAPDRLNKADILVVDKVHRKFIGRFSLDWNKAMPVPGTPYTLKVVRYVSDFAFDPKTGSVFTQSEMPKNPAVRLEISENGKVIGTPWLFYKFPQVQVLKTVPDYFIFGGYHAPFYTGLELAKDPGVPVVWTGSFLLVGGLFLSSYIYHRKIWVRVRPQGDGVILSIGGFGHKDKIGFGREFEEIVADIRTALVRPDHAPSESVSDAVAQRPSLSNG